MLKVFRFDVRNFVSETDPIRVNSEAEVKDSAAFRLGRPILIQWPSQNHLNEEVSTNQRAPSVAPLFNLNFVFVLTICFESNL